MKFHLINFYRHNVRKSSGRIPNVHLSVTKLKRGKDIKCFEDLPTDVQVSIDVMSMVDGKPDKEEHAKRTAAAIRYQHIVVGVAEMDKKEWTKLMIRHDIALFKLWQTHLVLNLALSLAFTNSLNSKDLGGACSKVPKPPMGAGLA